MAENKENKTVAKEKMVTVLVPRTNKDEDDLRVWVNDRSWLIKRGVQVEVPECVAEVLARSQEMLDKAMNYQPPKNLD